MSPYLQAKLLRFLNDGSFRRVGGDRELRMNVRIISATHRALEDMVSSGHFRQDLLFRLNVLNLHVPPLRERPGDILPLAQFFLVRACAQASRAPMRLSQAACAAMLANPWVGNIRQLIAAKYAGNADAVAVLAAKVQKGGTGVWPNAQGKARVMPPNNVTEAEAKALAEWVLAKK